MPASLKAQYSALFLFNWIFFIFHVIISRFALSFLCKASLHFGMQMTPNSRSPWQHQRPKLLLGTHYGWHLVTGSRIPGQPRYYIFLEMHSVLEFASEKTSAWPQSSVSHWSILNLGFPINFIPNFCDKSKPMLTFGNVPFRRFWRFALNRNNSVNVLCMKSKKKISLASQWPTLNTLLPLTPAHIQTQPCFCCN